MRFRVQMGRRCWSRNSQRGVPADGDLTSGRSARRSCCRGRTPKPARARFAVFVPAMVLLVGMLALTGTHAAPALATVSFDPASHHFRVAENTAPGTVVGTVTATDSDGDTLTYSIGGTDATTFQELFALNASTGQITVKEGATVNYEVEKKAYSIWISATDGKDDAGAVEDDPAPDASVYVYLSITNVDEPGVVTFSTTEPQVGVQIQVTLRDPDGRRGGFVSSYWDRGVSADGPFYADLADVAAYNRKRTYTPQDKEKYMFLRFTVWYMDALCNRVSILDKRCFKKAEGVMASRVRDENGLIALTQSQNQPASGYVHVTKLKLLENGTADSHDDPLQAGHWVKAYVRRSDVSDPNGVNALRQFETQVSYRWYRINTVTAAETELPPVYDEDGLLNTRFHTITDADVGYGIQARAWFLDDEGNREKLQSALHYVPPPANTPATGTPTITGTARVGEELSADTSGIGDADGIEATTMTYAWIRHDGDTATTIDGATESTYTLVSDDQGKTITVRVSFRDGYGYSETRTSAATAEVAEAEVGASGERSPNMAATGVPTITGTVEAGKTLTAGTKGISDANGTTNAVFSYQWLADDVDIDGATSASYSLAAADEGKVVKVRVSFTDDAGNAESLTSAGTSAVAAPTGPTASFENVPSSHDGGNNFTVVMRFSQAPNGLSHRTVAGSMLEVTGGVVNSATRLDDSSNIAWRIRLTPRALDAMTVTLPVRACTETGAVCFGTTPLAVAAVVTIPGPLQAIPEPPPTAPATEEEPTERTTPVGEFTGSFGDATLAGHDGSAFELDFHLNHDPPGLSYRTVKSGLFTVTGGTIKKARRITRGKNKDWRIRVVPDGMGDVTVTLKTTTDCAATHAVCASDGRMLKGGAQALVPGPAAFFSVADATVSENWGARLEFVVTLNRALSRVATVAYATSDGTATAGRDYTAASGTLTFAANETSKMVLVRVLNDAHNEGPETLTFRLSSPSGAALSDATATGTIINTDPVPQAWLARFGREAAGHVAEAIAERLRGEQRTRVVLGGHDLGSGESIRLAEGAGKGPGARLIGNAWMPGGAPRTGEDADVSWREREIGEVLLASSFHLASAENPDAGSRWSLWGRGARSFFDGREDSLTLDGDVTTAAVGVDREGDRWLLGFAIARSAGDGSFREGGPCDRGCAGKVESALMGFYPYARYRVSETFSVWGALGHGRGDLTLGPEGMGSIDTDVEMSMAAAGARGVLFPAREPGGFELALRTDVLATSTRSDTASDLVATKSDTSRVRLLLDGSRSFQAGDGVLTPSVEVGARYDGGDAERGGGFEMGAAVRYASGGLSMEAGARGLVTHAEEDYDEWGLSGSVLYAPGADGRGLSMQVGSAWGTDSGGAERLWAQAQSRLSAPGAGPPKRGSKRNSATDSTPRAVC